MAKVTAKVECTKKDPTYGDTVNLTFSPDYQDGRNKEWAEYTASLSYQMNVKASVAEHFEQGGKYTVTFEATED